MKDIKLLPKEKWKDYILPIAFESNEAYVLKMTKVSKGINIELIKEMLEKPVINDPKSMDYPDRLYQDYWDNPKAYGVFDQDKLIAAIEIADESWNNRLRITELWVNEKHRRQGIGKLLINKAIAEAKSMNKRALVLETQSSNVTAINFYLNCGFNVIGFDTIHYCNDDVENNMFRLELGMVL